ncbi:MAG: tetratricopeptide repeat protein [Minicystis sp.]
MTAPSGETCSSTAMAALQAGDFPQAALWFEKAARAFRAEGAPDRARAVLGNLGFARKLLGQHRAALEAYEEAIALLTPKTPLQEQGMVLMGCAGVLDLLGDRRAGGTWMGAAKAFAAQPLMVLVCQAHAAGAFFALGEEVALQSARQVVAALGPSGTPALVAGLIGAAGDSAGAAGVPFLAQAVWLMLRDPEACNPSNAPYLLRFGERVGFADPICVPVCALGLIRAEQRRGTPEHGGVKGHAVDLLHAVAAARGKSPEAMLEDIGRAGPALDALGEKLLALAPPRLWLVPESLAAT